MLGGASVTTTTTSKVRETFAIHGISIIDDKVRSSLGLEYACRENLREIYRELKAWRDTLKLTIEETTNQNLEEALQRFVQNDEGYWRRSGDPLTFMQQLIELGKEYRRTCEKIRFLENTLAKLDPEALSFIYIGEDDNDQGGYDDCYDITSQSTVVRQVPIFGKLREQHKKVGPTLYRIIKNPDGTETREACAQIFEYITNPEDGCKTLYEESDDLIVQAGPQYYPEHGAWSMHQHHLDAMDHRFEQQQARTELYADQDIDLEGIRIFPNIKLMSPLTGLALAVMRIIWPRYDQEQMYALLDLYKKEKRQAFPSMGKGDGITIKRLDQILEAKYDSSGTMIRPEHGARPCLRTVLQHLKNRGYIIDSLRDGLLHVRPTMSHEAYRMATMGSEDIFDLKSKNSGYQPKMYHRGGVYYPRIAILMNSGSKDPLFVDSDDVARLTDPEFKYAARRDYTILGSSKIPNGYIKRVRILVKNGFPFKGSSQLHPEPHTDYDPTGKYSYRSDWTEVLKNIFIQRLSNSSTKIVTATEEYWDKESGQKLTRYKRQAYLMMKVPKNSYPELASGYRRKVLVFCDIQSPFEVRGEMHLETLKEEVWREKYGS